MADRIAEQGALQDAISNNEINPPRLSLAGYIRGLFLDWSASPYNPLTRLTAKGRYLGYFWDNGAIGLSMDFANQSFIVKDGTLQSKSFSDIVNFSRTSNATVTRADGTIGFAPHNLLTFSEQFDNAAWAKSNVTISANSIASPVNSTITGDKIIASAVSSTHFVSQTVTTIAGNVYTASVYLKAGGYDFAVIYASGANVGRYFNLSTGVVGNTFIGAPTSESITSVGNGWYRCSITFTATASTVVTLYTNASQSATFTGDGVSGTFMWGAQLEIGSTATAYNPTTVKNLLGFSELFDNAAWTKSNSFVQTNLALYSEDFSNAAWTASNVTVTANNITAPNGYQTADKVTITTSDVLRNTNTVTIAASSVYTTSFYLKKNDFNWFRVTVADSQTFANSVRVWFNLDTGAVGSNAATGTGWTYASSSITNVGDGWYRCSVSFSTTATVSHIAVSSADADASLTRAPSGSSYFVWGAQLVQGSVAGDYRRTDAAALPVYYPNHNGVVVAEKLVENTASSTHQLSVSTTTGLAGGTYVASIYAKAAERTKVRLINSDNATGGATAIFDLSAGTATYEGITGNYSAGSAEIIPVGNGWYRCYVSATKNGSGNTNNTFIAQLYTTTNGYTGDGTSGIYIFGAQLSDSASLDPYVLNAAAAPTAAAYYGPRFDYDPVTLAAKGLLIEEQRTNISLYSEEFNNAWWNKEAVTISSNTIVSPDGTLDADTLVENTASARHRISGASVLSVTASTVYTFSIYAKFNGRFLVINANALIGAASVFNLSTGIVASTTAGSATITPVGNGWFRCTVTGTAATTQVSTMFVGVSNTTTDVSYTGDGTSGVYLWGAQLEAGAFATSYIPTVASQVTRTADVASIDGSNFLSWYNFNEGSVYTSGIIQQASNSTFLNIGDIANGEIERFQIRSNITNYQLIASTNASVQASITSGTYVANTLAKVVAAYKINDFALSANGNNPSVDTSGNTSLPAVLRIGTVRASGFANGTIKSISYYPVRLSNDVLKGLTA